MLVLLTPFPSSFLLTRNGKWQIHWIGDTTRHDGVPLVAVEGSHAIVIDRLGLEELTRYQSVTSTFLLPSMPTETSRLTCGIT